MKEAQVYNGQFFKRQHAGSSLSAMAVVPIVLELVRPRSVVDIGCGLGEWLVAFQEYGVDDILGVDGDYIASSMLYIPQENFKTFDVNKPFILSRTFDLAVCLEVAEHLEPEHASDFIESITRLAPVVLFSAAIPLQGGTQHVNEQWPDYWAQQFRARGFVPVDAIRKRIWSNPDIRIFYRQNTMFFCTEQIVASNSSLAKEFRETNQDMLSIVHPEQYFISLKDHSPVGQLRSIVRKIPLAKKIYQFLREKCFAPDDAR